jgi:DNA-binding NtrC family response regulator
MSEARILLVDDQPANLDVLCDLLEAQGYGVLFAPDGSVALKSAARALPDLVLLDVMMPGMDGYETCRRLKADATTRDIPVIFITARDVQEDVVRGFAAGGVDYIAKPFREGEVLVRLQTHLRLSRIARELDESNRELQEKNRALEEEIEQRRQLKGQLHQLSEREAERWGLRELVGQSPTLEKIFKDIRLMQENATTSVLINGESGTGKELIARAIHFGGPRREGPFVPVNCAALPADLAESLLFGHVKGAFSGADADRPGYFETAHGGTLFLDEVGDMPLALQAVLLRVLEDGQVWRVGDNRSKAVDVRVLAATNINLRQKIERGAFRQDLYYRLARFAVTAPALRERKEDIPLLARHFLQMFAVEMGKEVPELSLVASEQLAQYGFPGNVRELKNIMERALIESGSGDIYPRHLHFVEQGGAAGGIETSTGVGISLPLDLDQAVQRAELWVVEQIMSQCDGNISKVARILGTSRNRLYRILEAKKNRCDK